MRNQNFETDYTWNSSKCNILWRYKVLKHLLHYQHNMFLVVHKEATVRAYKILCCLPRIYLMYNSIWTGVSEEGIKISTARQHHSKSFGARRKHSITDKIAFYYFKKLNSDANKLFSNAIGCCLFSFFSLLFCETGSSANGFLCLTAVTH